MDLKDKNKNLAIWKSFGIIQFAMNLKEIVKWIRYRISFWQILTIKWTRLLLTESTACNSLLCLWIIWRSFRIIHVVIQWKWIARWIWWKSNYWQIHRIIKKTRFLLKERDCIERTIVLLSYVLICKLWGKLVRNINKWYKIKKKCQL